MKNKRMSAGLITIKGNKMKQSFEDSVVKDIYSMQFLEPEGERRQSHFDKAGKLAAINRGIQSVKEEGAISGEDAIAGLKSWRYK
ncbi:MAG TPA: hypothetical protein VHV83_01255 [Armatimonadota bacterium]|nr:hypothetical protein [Armatimonadota bacterium]